MTLLFCAILLALALIGVPLFVIVGAATALCFYLFTPDHKDLPSLLPIIQNMEGLVKKQEFLAIPLFMASGAIMTAGGIARRLVDVARAAFGWLPGGVAVASIVACAYFACISGSSPVTLIAVGSIMFPAMIQSRYPENFALGLVTTAGSLGCLLPPSISILIYAISISGSTASASPEDLFLAALGPAFLIAGLLALYSIWIGRKVPESRQPFSSGQLLGAVREGSWALALPLLVVGGIWGGLYTPSEAGAIATVYALFVTMFTYRELSWRKLFETLVEATVLMGSLILIIVLAFGLNEFLTLIDVQERLMELIRRAQLGPFGFLLLVNVILIVLGALMDSISCTLVFAPLLAPIAWELYGIDPLHFGVVFIVNMEIGYLMPPVATNLFVAAAVFRKPFGQVTRAIFPTLAITCVALAVVMYVPTISKAAVNWKRGVAIVEPFPWHGRPPVEAAAAGGEDGADTGKKAGSDGKTEAPVNPNASDLSKITSKSLKVWDDDEPKTAAPDAGAGKTPTD